MPLPQFIARRGEQLYYRRAYPQELWPVTGRAAFAMSLRTADPKEALRARPEAERRYTQRVDEARAEMARRAAMLPLTKASAEAIAVRWFLDGLDMAEDARLGRPVLSPSLQAENAEWLASEARRALAEGDLADRRRTAECLRDQAGFAPEPVADAALVRLLGRAAIALHDVEAGRVLARYDTRPNDPLFAAAMDAPPPVAPTAPVGAPKAALGRTIDELIEQYREAKFGHFSSSTQRAYVPVFRVMRELLGTDTRLASLTHEDGDRLFASVQAIPINAQKRKELRGLPLRKQIDEGKRLGLPTLSAKTINDGYMAHLNAIFGFAKDRGWIAFNPVTGRRARDAAAADKREPFGDRLRALFGAAPWTPRDASDPVRYFGPLLALFHGLRLAEIVGLRVEDVGAEQGQPMIYVRAGERGLKGRGSRRDLPMHPELVRLGFARFATERQKAAAADAPLFAGEKPNKRGQWGRQLGQWFAGRVRELGLHGRGLTIHALRHDFRDALREAGIEEPLADYLMGHARKGVAGAYGGERPYSVARLAEAIGKVSYEGLTLPA
jgi:integrase